MADKHTCMTRAKLSTVGTVLLDRSSSGVHLGSDDEHSKEIGNIPQSLDSDIV